MIDQAFQVPIQATCFNVYPCQRTLKHARTHTRMQTEQNMCNKEEFLQKKLLGTKNANRPKRRKIKCHIAQTGVQCNLSIKQTWQPLGLQ